MPLSEDEQRILRDIERNFYENDPDFAASVGKARGFGGSRRKAVAAGAAMVACLVLLLVSFRDLLPLAFAAFLGMVVSGFFAFQNLRRLGAPGLSATGEPEHGQPDGTASRARKRKK